MKLIDILAEVLPEVAGCPSHTAGIAVLRATQQLCKVSGAWREWLGAIPMSEGIAEYEVTPSDNGVIESVKVVMIGGQRLDPIDHASLAWRLPGWRTAFSSSPIYYNVDGPRKTITVYPTPKDLPEDREPDPADYLTAPSESSRREIRIKAVIMPSMNARSIPDDLWEAHGEAIIGGAKARLMLQRGQQWSEPKLGQFLEEKFGHAVAAARIDEEAGQVRSTTIVRPRAFR